MSWQDYLADILYGMSDVVQILFMIPLWGLFIIFLIWQITRVYDMWRYYHGKSSIFGDLEAERKSDRGKDQ